MWKQITAGVAFLFAMISSAFAALPAGIDTGLTEIQTDGLALADRVWVVLLAFLGAVILMKLAKRFFNKL